MKIDAPRIKSWVERIEALLEERAALNGDIRDIFVEIKKGDHDAKAIRKLIQRRAQDAGDLAQQDALLEAYTAAVAGKIKALEAIARGATTKEAAKAAGISTGAVSALVSVQKSRSVNVEEVQEVPHDPDTGEIEGDAPNVARDGEASADERDVSASSSPPESCGGVEEDRRHAEAGNMPGSVPGEETSSAPSRLVGTAVSGATIAPRAGVATGPQDTDWDAIIASQPAQIRRVPA